MNKKIIIQSAFNTMGFKKEDELNEEWIKYRLKIFANYTLKSIKIQTNQYFTFLFRCRNETIPLIRKEIGGSLPGNVLIIDELEYDLKVKELIKDFNYLFLVRLSSDDMYIKTFIDMLHNYNPKLETEILINQNCYNYEVNEKRLASFFHLSPQCYVLIYKTIDYLRGKRHSMKQGHADAILLKHELLSGINYMDTVHNKNIISVFKMMDNWKEIKSQDNINKILKEFGL